MSTKEVVIKDGKVKEAQTGLFVIELDEGVTAFAIMSGKMRKARVWPLPGDKVKVEFSPHDLTRGRIVYRYR